MEKIKFSFLADPELRKKAKLLAVKHGVPLGLLMSRGLDLACEEIEFLEDIKSLPFYKENT